MNHLAKDRVSLAKAPTLLLGCHISNLADDVLLSDCAVGHGAAVELPKVDLAGVNVGELVDRDHA